MYILFCFIFKNYFFLFVLFFSFWVSPVSRYSVFQLGPLSLWKFNHTDWLLWLLLSFPLSSNSIFVGSVLLYSKEFFYVISKHLLTLLLAIIFLTSNHLVVVLCLLVLFFFKVPYSDFVGVNMSLNCPEFLKSFPYFLSFSQYFVSNLFVFPIAGFLKCPVMFGYSLALKKKKSSLLRYNLYTVKGILFKSVFFMMSDQFIHSCEPPSQSRPKTFPLS